MPHTNERGKLPSCGRRARPLLCLAAMATLLCLPACGRRQGASDDDPIAKGRTTFMRYCTGCHGKDARGDGPLAKDLRIPPADLTVLAAENGGTYPEERVTRILAKGSAARGHGTDDMPAWGPVFNQSEGTEATTVDEAFRNLNQYLRSIQRKK
jgi:mono/diheme cytochrome c family protein